MNERDVNDNSSQKCISMLWRDLAFAIILCKKVTSYIILYEYMYKYKDRQTYCAYSILIIIDII